jgi:methyltransferase (TIGR00027 family)
MEPMDRGREAVANTGLLVAAIRARETARDDALFRDPFAAKLAGATGEAQLEAALAHSGEQSTVQIVVRTRFWDEELLRAAQTARQVVIVAAGMDARAYRLDWPAGTVLFEVDQPEVIAQKAQLLAGDQPRCRRHAVGVDLRDWSAAIGAAGFDPAQPTVWLMEGLLQYLDEQAVRTLFDRVDALSSPGSTLLYEVVGQVLLESPFLAPLLESMAETGSPWLFGTDRPGEPAQRLGWSAHVVDIADIGNRWNRWPAPAIPLEVPGVPRGYFVVAAR